MKFCPNCGGAVEAGEESCETCGVELAGVSDALGRAGAPAGAGPAPAVPTPGMVRAGDLTPQQLRKEIRWGVFQGILLAALIVLVIYIVIMLVVFGVIAGGTIG
jgi:uncharacterized membrane protein YvbJ